ncbi:MAG: hypothetical protein AB7U35_11320 [Sphingobium sp.]
MTARSYRGSCHCGRYAVVFSSALGPEAFTPRADQCGFCRKHNQAAISDPAGDVEIMLPADAPPPYRFGLGITDFHVCDRCGVFVAASWSDDDALYAVVNYRALDDLAAFTQAPVAIDFEGEDLAAREARRRKGWTPARIRKGA